MPVPVPIDGLLAPRPREGVSFVEFGVGLQYFTSASRLCDVWRHESVMF